jgi:enoyl-CoA hydratase/carnithine racemase
MEWVATGRIFLPDEALAHGLVRSIYAPEDLLPTAQALAAEIVANTSAVSVALARQLMWRMLGARHPMEAHQADSTAMAVRGRSADAAEGIAAFLEKRPAVFSDRVSNDLPNAFASWVEPVFDPG